MIDQRHCNAPSSPASSPPPSASSPPPPSASLTKPAFVPTPPPSASSSFSNTMRKNRVRPRGEHRRPSYLLPMPAATCATYSPSKSKPYTRNNDTDKDEHDNCSIITSQQSELHEPEQDGSPPNRRRRIFLFSGAAAAVVLLLVASIANTSAHGGAGGGSAAIRQLFPSFHQQGPSAAASSVDAWDARDVLLMAERDALAFKRDAAGLQRTNDRLKAELLMPSQAETEVEEEAEGRQ